MTTEPFESFAQNGEDVVLWRALGHIKSGSYLDIGANHPTVDSVTRAFYDHGWRGLLVEPMPEFAALLRSERPEDTVVEAAITPDDGGTVTLHEMTGTGLSTLVDSYRDAGVEAGHASRDLTVPSRSLNAVLAEQGWDGRDIHFMSVDTEGAERLVLESIDLRRFRPWVLIIEATEPNTYRPVHQNWEQLVLDAGYEYQFFDGLSRIYVAAERRDEVGDRLTYPATLLDGFTTYAQRGIAAENQQLTADLILRTAERDAAQKWLTELDALKHLHHDLTQAHHELSQAHHVLTSDQPALQARLAELAAQVQQLTAELDGIRNSASWRATRPLREARRRLPSGRG